MKKLAAELVGTFALVLLGCGAAVLAGFGAVGQLGIAFAFGLAIVAMAYGIGPVSGCHVNPAVSFGAFVAGRMTLRDFGMYVAAQCAGAILGAAVLYLIAQGSANYDIRVDGLGQNGYGIHSPGGFSLQSGFVFEVVATFLFLVAILGVTTPGATIAPFAGLGIGLTLTVIHIVGIQVTGVSVNPARSLGPALFVGGEALSQLWLFIVAPMIGAGLAGLTFRSGLLAHD
ncbi:MAG: aquaporin [Caulobacterales bacterium]